MTKEKEAPTADAHKVEHPQQAAINKFNGDLELGASIKYKDPADNRTKEGQLKHPAQINVKTNKACFWVHGGKAPIPIENFVGPVTAGK